MNVVFLGVSTMQLAIIVAVFLLLGILTLLASVRFSDWQIGTLLISALRPTALLGDPGQVSRFRTCTCTASMLSRAPPRPPRVPLAPSLRDDRPG
jgi:hypothetical protein